MGVRTRRKKDPGIPWGKGDIHEGFEGKRRSGVKSRVKLPKKTHGPAFRLGGMGGGFKGMGGALREKSLSFKKGGTLAPDGRKVFTFSHGRHKRRCLCNEG